MRRKMIAKNAVQEHAEKNPRHGFIWHKPHRRRILLIIVLALAACSIPAYPQPVQETPSHKTPLHKAFSVAAPLARAVSISKRPPAHTAPDFRLAGTDGQTHTLRQYEGRPVALFFFCGCPWCHRCAALWGQFQRGGALRSPAQDLGGQHNRSASPTSAASITLIVFSGDSTSASTFAAQAGLDLKQTVLLPDPDMRVTTLYQVDPCPRTFILDPQGQLRYTNNHKADAPQVASEVVIASRALDALRTHAGAVQPK